LAIELAKSGFGFFSMSDHDDSFICKAKLAEKSANKIGATSVVVFIVDP